MKTKIFTLLLAVAASVGTMFASDTQVDGIWYDFDTSTKTASVTYRGSSYSTYLEYSGSVVIPASVVYNAVTYAITSIGDYAFRECSSLTSIICLGEVPPVLGSNVFDSVYLTSIYVPCGSLDAYQTAEGWSEYASKIKYEP